MLYINQFGNEISSKLIKQISGDKLEEQSDITERKVHRKLWIGTTYNKINKDIKLNKAPL